MAKAKTKTNVKFFPDTLFVGQIGFDRDDPEPYREPDPKDDDAYTCFDGYDRHTAVGDGLVGIYKLVEVRKKTTRTVSTFE